MTAPITLPYGEWPSPIKAEDLATGSRSFEQIELDGTDIYWVEVRPDENGRYVVMHWSTADGLEALTPAGFSARTLVNSYGGGSVGIGERRVFFSNFVTADLPDPKDQRVHRQDPGEPPVPITANLKARYADFEIDNARGLVYCVKEDAGAELHGQPVQTLIAIDIGGQKPPITVASGADFYASPRLSPDRRQLCWIEWNYPSMPWEGTTLHVAELDREGHVLAAKKIAGHPTETSGEELNPLLREALAYSGESIVDPKWSPDGTLYFVSDRYFDQDNHWWNIHRVVDGEITPVTRRAAEFAAPPWRLGGSSYGFLSKDELLCTYTQDGRWMLARVQIGTGELTVVVTPYTEIGHLHVGPGYAAFVGASFTQPPAIVRYDFATHTFENLRDAYSSFSPEAIACFADPEPILFKVGPDRSETAHAFYYAPRNPEFRALADEKPPLLIFIHGGPTAAASASLSLTVQYFTSRGFAVVDVNYRGSTGFGRAFRQRMYGNWGIVDVEDCMAAANMLVARGVVDPGRIASRGGSSGGYTTLALATFTNLLATAASYYGISNLEMIAKDTDKLEAHYAELLVGPYPDAKEEFQKRSPLHHADRIICPLIIFQGQDDPVVPPEQARILIDNLLKRKLPVAYEFYPDESHGFRIRDNIIRSLEEELAFYGVIMGFIPAGRLRAPEIHNLPTRSG